MNILNSITLVFSFLFLTAVQAGDLKMELYQKTSANHKSYSYSDARKILFNEIHAENDSKGYFVEGVYCLDKYYPYGGAQPNGRLPSPNVFNTEHTWPQSKFSGNFPKSVQKTDLHHLYPTFSKINSQRGNLPFAEVDKRQDPLFCDEAHSGAALNTGSGRYFEPPHEHKGNVARSMFYFSVRYQIAIDPVQEYYLRLWHKEDPVDASEKARNEKVFKVQRNRNPFIDSPELVDQISDF